jgi:hypothetical protein
MLPDSTKKVTQMKKGFIASTDGFEYIKGFISIKTNSFLPLRE